MQKFILCLGGSTGCLTGIYRYWDHFLSEVLYKLIDAVVVTSFTTIVGVTLSYFLVLIYKSLFPHKNN